MQRDVCTSMAGRDAGSSVGGQVGELRQHTRTRLARTSSWPTVGDRASGLVESLPAQQSGPAVLLAKGARQRQRGGLGQGGYLVHSTSARSLSTRSSVFQEPFGGRDAMLLAHGGQSLASWRRSVDLAERDGTERA